MIELIQETKNPFCGMISSLVHDPGELTKIVHKLKMYIHFKGQHSCI